mmetsp:Transcript_19135/g.76680  ORF Transcript_19135/g.76680 Transcript_19135/m.76680 type:complete len:80 (-) Transcript_19135:321-560(-)
MDALNRPDYDEVVRNTLEKWNQFMMQVACASSVISVFEFLNVFDGPGSENKTNPTDNQMKSNHTTVLHMTTDIPRNTPL